VSKHLRKEIENLKRMILALSGVVEEAFHKAVAAIERRDTSLAEDVIRSDARVDEMEVEVEEECLKILALHQPVAMDLRYIVAVLKLNNDLERIGDLAVNIAEQGQRLADRTAPVVTVELTEMTRRVEWMLSGSLDALVNLDVETARQICAADDEVDRMHRQVYDQIQAMMREGGQRVDTLIHILSVSRYLERIADLSTNIAEDVLYMVDGEIVRHGRVGRRRDRSS
jgi:phosphate transport system protein